ncbi:hypothetical protein N7540_000894 [Penicillium herquei]|nr:hypothetical protein N7540_000894 [Penicillium herquei]
MRLINAKTLELEEYMDSQIPKYAILSHTWTTNEVNFQEMQGLSSEERAVLASDSNNEEITAQTTLNTGYAKIKHTCQRARRELEEIHYVWVDTCCIDKTSSAELSEAINSMMRWYENSEICYAYLADVPPGVDLESKESAFGKSRWFTRGWTLQELLAPNQLVFLASDWSYLSSREKLTMFIGNITGISLSLLGPRGSGSYSLRGALSEFSIARRMSWASRRITSRREDTAYCLLGIFGINMPLLYGEGNEAFRRLQEEIIKHSDDQSLFAWNPLDNRFPDFSSYSPLLAEGFIPNDRDLEQISTIGFLASSPDCFANSGDYMPCDIGESTPPFSITNKGLSMKIPLFRRHYIDSFVLLECQTNRDLTRLLAIPVARIKENLYARVRAPIHVAKRSTWSEWPSIQLYFLTANSIGESDNLLDFIVTQHIPRGLRVTGFVSPYSRDLGHSGSAEIYEMILIQGNIANEIRPWQSNALIWFEEEGENPQSFVLCFTLFYNGDKYSPLHLAGFTTECRLIHLHSKGSEMDRVINNALQMWVEQLAEFPNIGEENEVAWRVVAIPEDFFGEAFDIHIELTRLVSSERRTAKPKRESLTSLRDSVRSLLVPGVREQLLRVKVDRGLRSFLLRSIQFLRFLPWYFTFIVDTAIQNACSWEHCTVTPVRPFSLVDALYLAESIFEKV